MRELRVSLSKLRLSGLTVGADARNRTMLSPFGASTGRNTPSTTKSIFGPAVWLRGLIKPAPGRAVAYVDWRQQEFGIGAKFSDDTAMQVAYLSGDPYLTFGKQAGLIPPDGTDETHAVERELCKQCILGIGYGMGAESLARRIGKSTAYAHELLMLHRRTYAKYWSWSDDAQDHAMLRSWLSAVFGWRIHVGTDVNIRSIRNFPCQANGAEMLRLACSLATERGVNVIALIHDALLIEAAIDSIDEAVAQTQAAMGEASETVLGGFRLRSKPQIVRWPDRYMDPRGQKFWDRVMRLLPSGILVPQAS
jgi:hypothetical protein